MATNTSEDMNLKGTGQADDIEGSQVDETLQGGAGEDTLNGGTGDDVMVGGDGADDFELSEDKDVIEDFNWREGDQVVLPKDIDLSKLQITKKKDDVILKIKGEFKTRIENTSLKDIIKTLSNKASKNALDATTPEGTSVSQTIVNTGLIKKGINNEIHLPTQSGLKNVMVFDSEGAQLSLGEDGDYMVDGRKVTINKRKPGYYKIAAEFDWNNSNGSTRENYLTWMRDVIQFGDKDGKDGADPIEASSAFRLYMGDKISAIDDLKIDGSTSTYQMFDAAARFDGNLDGLLPKGNQVTDMYSMFRHAARFNNGATNARRDGDKDYDGSAINNWDTSNVTRMRMTFWNALSFDQPLSGWNVEAVEDDEQNGGMSRMFKNTQSFDQNLSSWEPNIPSNLQTDFNTSLTGSKLSQPDRYPNTVLPKFADSSSSYDPKTTVLKTKNLSRWIEGNKEIILPFNEDKIKEISDANISIIDNNQNSVDFELNGAQLILPSSGANQYTIEVTGLAWDNSKGADNFKKMNRLKWLNDVIQFADLDGDGKGDIASGKAAFAGYGGQTISDLNNLDTSELKSTRRMFSTAYRFDQDLGEDFLTANVTDAFAMFNDAGVFNNGGSSSIGDWDTSNIALMREMFSNAALFNQELKGWDTGSVRDQQGGSEALEGGMHNMFRNTPLYKEDLIGWDVEALNPDLNTSFNTKAIKSDEVIANDEAEKAQGKWPLFGQKLVQGDGGTGGGGGNSVGGGIENAPGAPKPPEKPSDPEDGSIDNQPIVPQPDSDLQPEPARQLREIDVKQNPNKKEFNLVLKGKAQKDELTGSKKDDKIKGGSNKDYLKGSIGNDYLYGGNGKDLLMGGEKRDVLQGDKGNDELIGGDGKDILYGANGDDQLTGGRNRDVFVLSRGNDVINDFQIGKDDIGLVYALDLKLKQKGDHLVIRTGDKIVNTKLLDVDKDDFLKNLDTEDYTLLPFVEVNVL